MAVGFRTGPERPYREATLRFGTPGVPRGNGLLLNHRFIKRCPVGTVRLGLIDGFTWVREGTWVPRDQSQSR